MPGTGGAELAGRLLIVERDWLVPMPRKRPEADFALRTTACPDWTVRDVLAHCSAALMRVVENRFEKGVFSSAANARDIADRAEWSNGQILDELERGMTEAGPVMAAADGRLDGIAFGEWVHAGDVREALGEPGGYAGPALPDAFQLLVRLTHVSRHVALEAELVDLGRTLRLGDPDRAPARYVGDAATLVRLYGGRATDSRSYELSGAAPEDINLFA